MSKDKLYRALVVGAGGVMGRAHSRIYSELPETELTIICDGNNEGLEVLKKTYNVKKVLNDYTKIDPSDFDIVSICTPTSTHFEVAQYFIKRGKPVLIEKPLCSNLKELSILETLAKDSGSLVMVGHVERFNPAVQKMVNNLDKVGELIYIETKRSSPTPVRIKDVGVIEDLSVHDLDIVNMIIGQINLESLNIEKVDYDNKTVLGHITMKNDGVVISNHFDWITPKVERKLKVVGKKGAFFLDYLNQNLMFYENIAHIPDFVDYSVRIMQVTAGNSTQYQIYKREPLKDELSYFIECVKSGKQPIPSFDESYNVLSILDSLNTL